MPTEAINQEAFAFVRFLCLRMYILCYSVSCEECCKNEDRLGQNYRLNICVFQRCRKARVITYLTDNHGLNVESLPLKQSTLCLIFAV